MLQYIVKRTLLMIPTFFMVSLVIFLVLNLAPGKPGDVAQEGGTESDDSGAKRESYRIFKEQFNLDKPILFNTRFGLDVDDVREQLLAILNEDGSYSGQQRTDAEDRIEDWGNYAVPGLVELLREENQAVALLAANRLRTNAKVRLLNEFGRDQTDEQKEFNRVASEQNLVLEQRRITSEMSEAEREAVIAEWEAWYQENEDRWDYGAVDRVGIFLFDTRFAKYWGNLLRLDFGVSHVDKQPVLQRVLSKLKYSISLSLTSVILAYFIAVPLGVVSAVNHNTRLDRGIAIGLFILYSLPSFFIATVLLRFLTIGQPFSLFPVGGFGSMDTTRLTTLQRLGDIAWHLVLPVFCMTYGALAALSRYARTGLLDVIRADYIRTARAKGLTEGVVILKHAVRNGMIPILTLLGSLLPVLLSGSVVIEYIFAIPGMGTYMFDSIQARDYNVIMAVLLMSSTLTMAGLLLSDISYALVDPRISFD